MCLIRSICFSSMYLERYMFFLFHDQILENDMGKIWIEFKENSQQNSDVRRSKYCYGGHLKTSEVLTDEIEYQLHDVHECKKKILCKFISALFIEVCISIFDVIHISFVSWKNCDGSSFRFSFRYRNYMCIMIWTFSFFVYALWSIRKCLCQIVFGSRVVRYQLDSFLTRLIKKNGSFEKFSNRIILMES